MINKQEYAQLQQYKEIIKIVETAIHREDQFRVLLIHTEDVARDLWDNDFFPIYVGHASEPHWSR